MSLYKRGGVWWYEFVLKGERYRGTCETASKAAAKVKEEEARSAVRLGGSQPMAQAGGSAQADASSAGFGGGLSVRQLLAKWYAAEVQGTKKQRNADTYLKILERHMNLDMPLGDLRAAVVADALQSRRREPIGLSQGWKTLKEASPAEVNRMVDHTIRSALAFAVDVLEVPVRSIKWKRIRLAEPEGRIREFTSEELSKWAEHMPAHHLAVRDFMARYGVRLQEGWFPLSAINLETGEVTLRGDDRKAGNRLVIPLTDEDRLDVAARLGRAKVAGLDTIWFREVYDKVRERVELEATSWRGFQMASKRALAKAGIEDAKPAHDLRHHAASQLLRHGDGTNLKTVQALLGHKSIASTARYAHVGQEDIRRALRGTVPTHSPTTTPRKAEKA